MSPVAHSSRISSVKLLCHDEHDNPEHQTDPRAEIGEQYEANRPLGTVQVPPGPVTTECDRKEDELSRETEEDLNRDEQGLEDQVAHRTTRLTTSRPPA